MTIFPDGSTISVLSRLKTVSLTAMAALFACNAMADEGATAPKGSLSFVACPVYRDVDQGPKSGCWLATDNKTGIRYDISNGRTKPFLGRLVLVEGTPSDQPDICGGAVLAPARVSVLAESCAAHMLPAEDFPSKPFQLPTRVMMPTGTPLDEPEPPFGPRVYHIFFDLNSDFPIYQYSELIMLDAANYAVKSNARTVRVTGYAATKPIAVSGYTLREDKAIARSRAELVALAMRRLLVPEKSLTVAWKTDAKPVEGGDEGLIESSKRRVTIEIAP